MHNSMTLTFSQKLQSARAIAGLWVMILVSVAMSAYSLYTYENHFYRLNLSFLIVLAAWLLTSLVANLQARLSKWLKVLLLCGLILVWMAGFTRMLYVLAQLILPYVPMRGTMLSVTPYKLVLLSVYGATFLAVALVSLGRIEDLLRALGARKTAVVVLVAMVLSGCLLLIPALVTGWSPHVVAYKIAVSLAGGKLLIALSRIAMVLALPALILGIYWYARSRSRQ